MIRLTFSFSFLVSFTDLLKAARLFISLTTFWLIHNTFTQTNECENLTVTGFSLSNSLSSKSNPPELPFSSRFWYCFVLFSISWAGFLSERNECWGSFYHKCSARKTPCKQGNHFKPKITSVKFSVPVPETHIVATARSAQGVLRLGSLPIPKGSYVTLSWSWGQRQNNMDFFGYSCENVRWARGMVVATSFKSNPLSIRTNQPRKVRLSKATGKTSAPENLRVCIRFRFWNNWCA